MNRHRTTTHLSFTTAFSSASIQASASVDTEPHMWLDNMLEECSCPAVFVIARPVGTNSKVFGSASLSPGGEVTVIDAVEAEGIGTEDDLKTPLAGKDMRRAASDETWVCMYAVATASASTARR